MNYPFVLGAEIRPFVLHGHRRESGNILINLKLRPAVHTETLLHSVLRDTPFPALSMQSIHRSLLSLLSVCLRSRNFVKYRPFSIFTPY